MDVRGCDPPGLKIRASGLLLGHPSEPNASVRRDAILVVIGDGSLVETSTLTRRDDTFAPEGLRTSNPSLGIPGPGSMLWRAVMDIQGYSIISIGIHKYP